MRSSRTSASYPQANFQAEPVVITAEGLRPRPPRLGSLWRGFVHLDEAAAATVLALEHEGHGLYNIVDDEPPPTASRRQSWRESAARSRLSAFPARLPGSSRARPPS
jgi:nucleoside-diphosphate-sugar epimerase